MSWQERERVSQRSLRSLPLSSVAFSSLNSHMPSLPLLFLFLLVIPIFVSSSRAKLSFVFSSLVRSCHSLSLSVRGKVCVALARVSHAPARMDGGSEALDRRDLAQADTEASPCEAAASRRAWQQPAPGRVRYHPGELAYLA